jgi:hypothetical protein
MSEGVYLIHPREFIKTNENVYKLGRSLHLDIRVKQYPNGSNTLLMLNCNNSIVCEKYLINLFKTKFIQKTYYGTEYFEGDKKIMIKEIINYINIVYDEEDAADFEIVKNSEKVEKIKNSKKVEKVEKVEIVEIVKNSEKVEKIKKLKEKNIKTKIKDKSERTCPKCKIEFKFQSMLKTHFTRSYHCLLTEEEINIYFNNSNNNINKCIKCNKKLNNIQAYKRHLKETKCGKSQAQL